jgi:hypothetical protein
VSIPFAKALWRSGPALALFLALPFGAGVPASAAEPSPPVYTDDRSTPEAVIGSLYNAIDRQEHLRAYSYFRDEPDLPDFETFAAGYAKTARTRVRMGQPTEEGGAGSLYFSLPVAVEAIGTDGRAEVFTGCYELRLVQPAVQVTPPFKPMGIVKGKLAKVTTPFDAATGTCPDRGLQ